MPKLDYSTRIVPIAALFATALGTPAGVSAQSEGADQLDEIVVSALRREVSLQETPVSVTAFVASDFEKLSVRNVGDVISYTPNVVTTSGPTGHNDGFYFIRGIGNVDLNPATDPGVGTYIDGVYIGRVTGANLDAMDIERVEILRGPQGTLFGRNTIGGAINIVTHSPGDVLAGDVRVIAGEDSRLNVLATLDVPFSDTFAGTFSFVSQNKEGRGVQVDTGETFGDIENIAGRMKFVLTPSDRLTATFSADYTQAEGTSAHSILVNANPAAVSPLGVPLPADLGADIPADIDDNYNSIDPIHDTEGSGANLTLDIQLSDAVSLKSITAYRQVEQFDTNDFDASRYVFYDHFFNTDADQFSQELQLAGDTERLNWLLGAYYYEESAFHNNGISLGGNNGVPPGIPGVEYATRYVERQIRNNQRFDLDIDAIAVFAHLTWSLTDRFSATLGLRWTEEEKNQRYDFFIDNTADVFSFAGFPPIAFPTLSPDNPFLTIPTSYTESWSETTPKFGLEYRFSDSIFGYLTYARGFRSGGFNGRPQPDSTGTFAQVEPYDPEISDNYEIGLKTEFFDNALRLNTSAFFTVYQDIQLLVLGDSGFFETENAAEAELSGIEIELLGRTDNGFEVNAALGLLDTEYTELDPGTIATGITASNVLPNAPETTLNLGIQKLFTLAGGSSITARADYIWQDDVYFNATNLPGEFQDAYGVVNLRLSYTSPDEVFELAAYGLNVAGEDFFVNGQDVSGPLGTAFQWVGPRREWGVEAAYNFGER